MRRAVPRASALGAAPALCTWHGTLHSAPHSALRTPHSELSYTPPVTPRFFAPEAEATGSSVALPDDEAAHLTRVLRLGRGDSIRVFDGRGHEWHAIVSEISRQRVVVRLGDAATPAPESRVAITLASAALKSDKMDDVVRDAVMLGVIAIQPLITQRTEIAARAMRRGGRISRWQRIAVASAKQCGRAVVPPVRNVVSLAEALGGPPPGLRVMLAEPGAGVGDARALRRLPRSQAVELFVGPEGGWTDDEVQCAIRAGSMLITLRGQTLRADAAPLVAVSALRAVWGDL